MVVLLSLFGCVRYLGSSDRDAGLPDSAAHPDARGEHPIFPDVLPHHDQFLVPDSGCPAGLTQCGPTCVDLTSDPLHCGMCGEACTGALTCVDSLCRCVQNGLCNGCCDGAGKCVTLGSVLSPAKCGRDGEPCKTCDDGKSCTADACTIKGERSSTLNKGYCLINGVCVAQGASMVDACMACDPTKSSVSWTAVAGPGCVVTVAGDTVAGFADGPAATARFSKPQGLTVDAAGAVFVADTGNHRIRKISGGVVTTVAGDGQPGLVDGTAATARFNEPAGIAIPPATIGFELLVADTGNHVIRRVEAAAVKTQAGTGLAGSLDGDLLVASFNQPAGLTVVGGKVYVADLGNHCIRVVDSSSVAMLAGTGRTSISAPWGVVAAGSSLQSVIYIGDSAGHKILSNDTAGPSLSTVAGSGAPGFADGSPGQFNSPRGIDWLTLATDGSSVVVADSNNHAIRVVKEGVVSTLAGSGTPGHADGKIGTATFNAPSDVAVDTKGNIYVADTGSHCIRMIVAK